MHITQAIHRNVQQRENDIATVFGPRRRSWADLAGRIARFAGGLKALGVSASSPDGYGDRVAILALNSDRYVEFFYATAWAGGVAVPINIRWSNAEILYSLEDSKPSVFLFDDYFLESATRLKDEAPFIKHWVYAGEKEPPEWAQSYEDLVAENESAEDATVGGDNLAVIFYTGGTTGFPKGVMLSHNNITFNAFTTSSVLAYAPETRMLHAAPMFHIAAASIMFNTTFFGGTHIIMPAFNPPDVYALIAKESVSHLLLVPTMIKLMVDYAEEHKVDTHSVKQLAYGASPISETVLRKAMAVFAKADFVQAFGQTELSPCCTLLEPQHHVLDGPASKLLRSAGRALPGVDVKIAGDDGTELPRGEPGEVWVRGPNTMLGYWNKPETTAETKVDGWVRMGDAAYMDEDGFIYVVDRLKDMIISGGENVFSAEVENAVSKHPVVSDCAVIGIPSDEWGETVHAIIVLKPGEKAPLEQELVEHCKEHIAGFKCPRSFEFRTDPLPVSGAGKVLKTELRKPYWETDGRTVG